MVLSAIAENILQERYYDRDEKGNFTEDWQGLSRRVAKHIAGQEKRYGIDPKSFEEDFYQAIYNLDFVPNTPCLMNAGSVGNLNLFSACFVQIPDDSIDSIMQHAWHSAKLFQAGAGVGYNFSKLRGEGEIVSNSMRPSSGSISFMKHIFNSVGEVVKQGGRRRAAMMGLLSAQHPEIENFIKFKNLDGKDNPLRNFNISIDASDRFMRAVEKGEKWELKNIKDSTVNKTVYARDLFDDMLINNWQMAEPGMIWFDEINRHNPLLNKGYKIECVNPCGEATLLNYENCCLGSINLVNHVSNGQIDWFKLEKTIRTAIRFLDNVVDANEHVAKPFEEMSLATRRIGLGVTGFADVLVMLGSKYGSSSSFMIATEIAEFLNTIAILESNHLADLKGPYPLWDGSWHQENNLKLRNVSLLAIAPEGSRSLITSTSPSIEPNFGRVVVRSNEGIGAGKWTHPLAVNKDGSNNEFFVTTYEIPFSAHVKMQSAWQNALNKNMVAQSISKTNNAPESVSISELGEAYLEAWRTGCKGLTVYRDKSRDAVYYDGDGSGTRDENGKMIKECSTGSCDIGMQKVNVG